MHEGQPRILAEHAHGKSFVFWETIKDDLGCNVVPEVSCCTPKAMQAAAAAEGWGRDVSRAAGDLQSMVAVLL